MKWSGLIICYLISAATCFAEKRTENRIVTLAPVLSEWTAELLVQSHSEKDLIGVSEYSYYPAFLKKIQTVGSYAKLNIEAIARLKPDLVIASSEYNRSEQLEQLRRLHVPIEVLPRETFFGMGDWIKNLGRILNRKEAAEKLASRWNSEAKALVTRKREPKRFFLEIQHQPLVTIGKDSFLNDAFTSVGYENIFKSLPQGYPKVSTEAVLKENPEKIFILDLTGNSKDFETAKQEWEKFGKQTQILSGDDFARCSFSLLKGLKSL